MIGDTQTAGLVGRNGSIDWLCLPRFDSAACFAALLGDRGNGRWLLAPRGAERATSWRYRPDTLVLETDWETPEGAVTVTDCMPPRHRDPDVVRVVDGRRGRVRVRMEMVVRFDYGRNLPWIRRVDGRVLGIAGPDAIVLDAPVEMDVRDQTVVAEFDVAAGQRVPFVLEMGPSHGPIPSPPDAGAAVEGTTQWWREWIGRCSVGGGPWADAVRRSLLTLKALTYAPTGGIVAAPTTSLPEQLGGVRNWDYRYCWLRDATFTLYALLQADYLDEAAAWRDVVAGRRRVPGGDADHVRLRRRTPASRAGAGVARGLRAITPGAHRQRRRRPAPARRLRRGDGRLPAGAASRDAARPPGLAAAVRADGVPGGQLA